MRDRGDRLLWYGSGNNADNADSGREVLEKMKNQIIRHKGKLYIPIQATRNPDAVLLSAAYDGEEVLRDEWGADYVSADWLATEFPEYKKSINKIKQEVKT